MAVASLTEISAALPQTALRRPSAKVERANKTLRGVQSAWVKDMNILMEDDQIRVYKVNLRSDRRHPLLPRVQDRRRVGSSSRRYSLNVLEV